LPEEDTNRGLQNSHNEWEGLLALWPHAIRSSAFILFEKVVCGSWRSYLRRKVLREGNLLIESLPSKRAIDHHSLAMYYEEQAQLNKTKAQDWDFQADYDKKFPSAYSGTSTVAEHVARCAPLQKTLGRMRSAMKNWPPNNAP
jgi:hypothetical protein